MMRATILAARAVALDSLDIVDLSATPWRWIPLSATDPSLRALVDAEDHAWLSQYVWNVWHSGNSRACNWMKYAKRNEGPARATVRMHREVMIRAEPHDDVFLATHVVDHRNGQTLDNRKANLRFLTKGENAVRRRARGSAPSLDSIVLELVAALPAQPQLQEVPF